MRRSWRGSSGGVGVTIRLLLREQLPDLVAGNAQPRSAVEHGVEMLVELGTQQAHRQVGRLGDERAHAMARHDDSCEAEFRVSALYGDDAHPARACQLADRR